MSLCLTCLFPTSRLVVVHLQKLPDRKYLMLSIANVRRAASDCSLSEHLQPDDQSMDICIIDGNCPRLEVLKLFMIMDQGELESDEQMIVG